MATTSSPAPTSGGDVTPTSWAERHIALLLFGGLAALSVVGYGGLVWLTQGDFDAQGALSLRGAGARDFTLPGGACHVDGADAATIRIVDGEGHGLHLERRAKGTIAFVDLPGTCEDGAGCQKLQLDGTRCSLFEVRVEDTNALYNKHRVWRGSFRARCELEEGTVEASLQFDKCV
jgi:hypothetical protein